MQSGVPATGAIYLDSAATTAVDPRVVAEVLHHLTAEFGNAGSRTHEYGARARSAADLARERIADVVGAGSDEVVFTSGATEANNLALLGLAAHGDEAGRRHLVATQMEHKSVLEPLARLGRSGWVVDLVDTDARGWVEPEAVSECLRDDTLAVSVMHVNNETGVRQPIAGIADALGDHPAYLHVDAAQSFGKELEELRHPRIDLVSASGHKLFAPKGVGALITRRRGRQRIPLTPLFYGGGQERALRPGTLPVALVAGFGLAAELAIQEHPTRRAACVRYRHRLLEALGRLQPRLHGDQDRVVPHIVNLSFPGLDAEAVILVLKGLVAISNGSACTSAHYEPSHVVAAMGLSADAVRGAVRFSWDHATPEPDFDGITTALASLV